MYLRKAAGCALLLLAVALMFNIAVGVEGRHLFPGGDSPFTVIGAIAFGLVGGTMLGGRGT